MVKCMSELNNFTMFSFLENIIIIRKLESLFYRKQMLEIHSYIVQLDFFRMMISFRIKMNNSIRNRMVTICIHDR